MAFSKFYETYIRPFEKEYLILGALIVLFSFMQDAFSESLTRTFILGLVLTMIFVIFFITLNKLLYGNQESSTVGFAYITFYVTFFFAFLRLCFLEYSIPFAFSSGLFLGFIIVMIGRDIKNLAILLVIKKIKNGFLRILAYLSVFVLIAFWFSFCNIYVLGYEGNYPGEEKMRNLSSLAPNEVFLVTGLSFISVMLFGFFIAMITELSHKNFRKYYSKIENIKGLVTYHIISEFYTNIKNKFKRLTK